MANITWIDDNPEAWDTVSITPNGSKIPYKFLCRYHGSHGAKIDHSQALDRSGARTRTAGWKGAEVSFDIVLFNDQEGSIYDGKNDPNGLARYSALMAALQGAAEGGKLLRHSIDHPALTANRLSNGWFFSKATLLQRKDSSDELVSTITFVEDRPPAKKSQQAVSGKIVPRDNVEKTDNQPSTLDGFARQTSNGTTIAVGGFTDASGATGFSVNKIGADGQLITPASDQSVINP